MRATSATAKGMLGVAYAMAAGAQLSFAGNAHKPPICYMVKITLAPAHPTTQEEAALACQQRKAVSAHATQTHSTLPVVHAHTLTGTPSRTITYACVLTAHGAPRSDRQHVPMHMQAAGARAQCAPILSQLDVCRPPLRPPLRPRRQRNALPCANTRTAGQRPLTPPPPSAPPSPAPAPPPAQATAGCAASHGRAPCPPSSRWVRRPAPRGAGPAA